MQFSRVFNSLQFRLYTALILLSLLIGGTFLLIAFAATSLTDRQIQVDVAAQQRSNAYFLANLARRYVFADSGAEKNALAGLLADAITVFDQAQLGLRNGNDANGLVVLANREASAVMDDIDEQWVLYRQELQALLDADPEDLVTINDLLRNIDNASSLVYTFADSLVDTFTALNTREFNTLSQTILTVSAGVLILVIITFSVGFQTTQAINRLRTTASAFAAGNLKARAETHTLQEIAQVGTVFNTMAGRLDDLIVSLENRATEAQQARERAERSDQVKSAFLASVSHELRTPLNSIINFTKFVVRGVMGPVTERQTESLNKVVDSAKHLLNLINDVLDMSKIESGSLNLFVEENINVNDIITHATETAQSLLVDKPVTLQIQAETLPPIKGDRQRILQILLNILSNACKFTEEGTITLHAKAEGQEIRLAVTDTGPGIPLEDQANVFEPFKQTETGLRQGSGTGLGMPISKNLAEAHQGRLWLESTVGKGTTFYVSLPIASEALQVS